VVLVSGIAVVDLIASGLERVARPGELVFGSISTTLGGHACNVSVDLVRLGFPRTQIRVVFPAGRDLFGDFLARRLREQGLRADPVRVVGDDPATCARAVEDNRVVGDDPATCAHAAENNRVAGAPTSLDLILVARGEDRRYHADPGANIAMEAGPVLALLEKHRPLVYYAGGVGLLGRFDTDLAAVLRRARELGATTFVDVVSPYKKTWAFLRRALPFTDVFHCNADEAASLVGERDPSKAAAALRRLGASSAFVTLGGKGVVAAVPGASLRLPAFPVRVVDPTGAGDAFSAGLIAGLHRLLARGRNVAGLTPGEWLDLLVRASACGAVCVTGVGTTTAVDGRKVDALVRQKGKAVRDNRVTD
jgi:sugar/nucleoside kinase (ribokinase family)